MKKIMKVLPVIFVVALVITNVFAVSVPSGAEISGNKTASAVEESAKNVWSTVVTIVQILAVAAVVFAGLRYMFASADQKADIKKSMGILAVGAVLVFAATTILSVVASAATQVIQTT